MKDNKNFMNDVEETQVLEASGEEGKKEGPTVKILGHTFAKKKAVAAGIGGLVVLALALALGGAGWAMSGAPAPQPADTGVKATAKTEAKDEEEQYGIGIGVEAEEWVKDKSSPVIVHVVNEEEDIDYYHAYDANETAILEVPASGEYEVSFISPVNADGSIYKVPEATMLTATAVAEDDEGGQAQDSDTELPFEFEQVPAGDVTDEQITGILDAVAEAVQDGDETLTGDAGAAIVEQVEENSKANPNVDDEKVEQAADAATDAATSGGKDSDSSKESGSPSSGTGSGSGSGSSSSSSTSSGSSSKGSGSSSSSSGSSSSSTSSSSSSASQQTHTHSWVAQTKTVHHDAQYKTVHHDAQYKTVHHDAVTSTVVVCNHCGNTYSSTSEWSAHSKDLLLSGITENVSYHTETKVTQAAYDEKVLVKAAYDEKVLVKAAYDEKVTTGYKCSTCGATK